MRRMWSFRILVILAVAIAASAQEAEMPAVDPARIAALEQSARNWLDFLLRIQRQGALPTNVTVNAETGAPAPFSEVTNDDSAADLGKPFLWGYRVFQDERYLVGARQLADFYAAAQFPEGGWAYAFTLKEDGSIDPVWRIANFEEWVQSNGLRHLAAVYQLTGEAKYKEAALKAGEMILGAQHADGWWPWGAAVSEEDARAGYLKGPTLNDWSLNACVGDCLVLYHMTQDARYLDAIRRAGEWILSAHIDGAAPGWAAQYGMDGKPCWARFMEPPCTDTMFGSYGAGSALLMLYDITGDNRYLPPLRGHLEWLESIPAEKKGWLWYAYRSWSAEENKGTVSDYTRDLTERFGGTLPSDDALAGIAIEAGEPVIAYHYQMVPVDHLEMKSYLTPLNGHYGSRSEQVETWLAEELAKRGSGPIRPLWSGPIPAGAQEAARPSRESCAKAFRAESVVDTAARFDRLAAREAADRLATKDENGLHVNVGHGCSEAVQLLRQVAYGRVALGDAPPDIIPFYAPLEYFGDIAIADPACDWYAVKLPD